MSVLPEVSKDNFEQEVLKNSGPVLVDFWAPWCGPCKMLLPILEKTAEEFQGKLKIVKLNVEENKVLADSRQIMNIPSLVMFSKGEEVGRIAGFMNETQLKGEINDLLDMAG